MTLEQLEQYRDMRQEAKLWEKELADLRRKYGGVVKDTVSGSSAEYPYTTHPITIAGVQTKPNQRIARREKRLQDRKEKLETMLDEIDAAIDELPDSQLRQIIQYHYIDGFSWVKTARMIGGKNTDDSVRKRVTRYFKSVA